MKKAVPSAWDQIEDIAKGIIIKEIAHASEVFGKPCSKEQLEQLRQGSVLQLKNVSEALSNSAGLQVKINELQFQREQIAALKAGHPAKPQTFS